MKPIETSELGGVGYRVTGLGPARVAAVAPVKPADTHKHEALGEVISTAPSAGDAAPVDSERVDQIRRAIEQGHYPIVPTRIADAMIAAGILLRTK